VRILHTTRSIVESEDVSDHVLALLERGYAKVTLQSATGLVATYEAEPENLQRAREAAEDVERRVNEAIEQIAHDVSNARDVSISIEADSTTKVWIEDRRG
jgi:hypothetical protein